MNSILGKTDLTVLLVWLIFCLSVVFISSTKNGEKHADVLFKYFTGSTVISLGFIALTVIYALWDV